MHSPARSLKRHSFETSLHHEGKSSVIWNVQSYGASSQEGLPCTDISFPHWKILEPIKIDFDDIWPEWPWIAFFAGYFRQLQLTRHLHWSISVHMSCVMLSHDLWRNQLLNRFPNSPEVMLFFQPTYVSLLPKFSFKHWWMWNGNFKTLLYKCFWLNSTQ
mgnify:CR=1 FL=1